MAGPAAVRLSEKRTVTRTPAMICGLAAMKIGAAGSGWLVEITTDAVRLSVVTSATLTKSPAARKIFGPCSTASRSFQPLTIE